MSRQALVRSDAVWSPAPSRVRRARPRLAPIPWPGDATPADPVSAELPGWLNQDRRPPVRLLAMAIAGIVTADLSAVLFLLGT